MTPAIRAMLLSLPNPAYIKTTRWDVAAWNEAAVVVLDDLALVPPERRNTLLLVFADPRFRTMMVDWEADARRVIAKFRLDAAEPRTTRAFQRSSASWRRRAPSSADGGRSRTSSTAARGEALPRR